MQKIFRFILLAVSLIVTIPANAQNKKKKKDPLSDLVIYLFDGNFKSAPNLDAASFFMQVVKESDSMYVCRYYLKFGPMIKQESYLDSNFEIPNGRFCWYNFKGELDSTGWVTRGKKDGYWDVYEGTKQIMRISYDEGNFIYVKDYKNNLYREKGATPVKLDEKEKADSIEFASVKHQLVEAKFPDGPDGWASYVERHLTVPTRLMNVLGQGKHDGIVSFLVNKFGEIKDVYLLKSIEWSGDREIFKLIQNAPKWKPAIQDGRLVAYRQRQSITFDVNN